MAPTRSNDMVTKVGRCQEIAQAAAASNLRYMLRFRLYDSIQRLRRTKASPTNPNTANTNVDGSGVSLMKLYVTAPAAAPGKKPGIAGLNGVYPNNPLTPASVPITGTINRGPEVLFAGGTPTSAGASAGSLVLTSE